MKKVTLLLLAVALLVSLAACELAGSTPEAPVGEADPTTPAEMPTTEPATSTPEAEEEPTVEPAPPTVAPEVDEEYPANGEAPADDEPAPAEGVTDPETEDWQLYQFAEEGAPGFQVKYPADWVAQEVRVQDPEAERPLVHVVGFMPADWAQDYMPVLLEIGMGSDEDYLRLYGEPIRSERMVFGEREVTLESPGMGEMFYVVRHPADETVRAVFRDMVEGFPERLSHLDLSQYLGRMISTFEFVY